MKIKTLFFCILLAIMASDCLAQRWACDKCCPDHGPRNSKVVYSSEGYEMICCSVAGCPENKNCNLPTKPPAKTGTKTPQNQNGQNGQNQQSQQVLAQQKETQRQLNVLAQKSQSQASVASNLLSGLGSIAGTMKTNTARKNIADDNAARQRKFGELKRQLENEHGKLVDCSSCAGHGYNNCASCSGNGYKKCSSCNGKGGETCTVCKGSGKGNFNMACVNCFGKGTKDCLICGNAGKELCGTCNGLGERFCSTCNGTGQRFERDYAYTQSQTQSNNVESTTTVEINNTNAAEEEKNIQWLKDVKIMGSYFIRKNPKEMPATIKQVYYIVYERIYATNTIKIQTYVLKKYSDDTWMLQNDLKEKIKLIEYFDTQGVKQLFGAYDKLETAKAAINRIKASGSKVQSDDRFLLLNATAASTSTTADKDFWNQ